MIPVRRLLVASMTAALVLLALAPLASADRTFSLRYQTVDRADSVFVANTLMTCPVGGTCANVRAGTNTANGNGDFNEINVDADSDGTTFSSSSADLSLPVGATIVWAGLYWGADTTAGTGGSAAPNAAANNVMSFKTPALGSYTPVTASVVDTDSQRTSRFQGFADVTSLVQAGGAGTYWGANVQAGTGNDRYAGWSLAVVYKDPAKSIQQVGVYDGLTSLVSGTRPSVSIPLDSFLTPASGTVNAKVGLVAWEGDNDISSETATLNGSSLVDAANLTTNQFNSSIARAGAQVTTKNPNYVNQLGIDADQITATNFIPNNATSTTLALGTSQDTYVPGVVTLVNDTYLVSPANTVAPTISGTASDRAVLTANPGTWTGSPAPTYTYQWRRCNAAGASCVDIGGATASTYTLTATDVGSTIKVVVTGTSPAGNAGATSAQTAVVTALAPFVVSAPALSGTAQDGQVLTSSQGTWDGTPTITYARSWQRCNAAGASCVTIAGQTGTTYTLTSADVGSTIRGVVTATNGAGPTSQATTQSAVVTAAPPVNTVVPVVSGTATDGLALSSNTGTWTGTPTITYTYQWQRCNAAGASCADIASATSSTYTLVSADVGNTVRSKVTGTNAGGNSFAVSAVSAVVAAAPPVNTVVPVVTGTARDGLVLSSNTGTWTGTPTITYTYQWQRCNAAGASCADIASATASTYTAVAADVGNTLRSKVTGTNAGGNSFAVSVVTGVVAAAPPVNTVVPVVTGTARDGLVLSSNTGTWTGTPTITYTYQWQRCNAAGASCADIASATASTYTAVSADVGNTLRSKVTGTNAGGNSFAVSVVTGVVAAAPPVNTVVPVVTGTARDGLVLSSNTGTWTGTPTITYTYQWQRCNAAGASCADIASATASTYTAVSADVGNTLRSKVTGTNAAGNSFAVSLVTGVVAAAPPVNTVLPVISGTARDTQTLSATTGTWTGTPTITYTYQWQRCDALGAACQPIAGATASTYTLTSTDVGGTARVVVTGTNGAGNSQATAAASAVIVPTAPVNTVLPVVSGALTEGSTASASTGTWTGTPTITYTYQWRRCNPAGNACADIAGATASTYTLVAADVGNTLRIVVTGTNGGGSSSATSSAATGNPGSPANTAVPTISGTTRDTQTLTAANGTWTGTAPVTFTYQWQRCNAAGASCADIAGSTAVTRTLTPADVGSTLRVRVTGTNVAGSAQATSAQSAVVVADPPVNTAVPTISGTTTDGQTLTSAVGTWTGTPTITYGRQWRRCNAAGVSCADIAGATGTTYTLTPADVGSTIRVRVTGTNAGGSSAADSAATATVAPDPPVNTVLPAISGTARDGLTLTRTVGTWTGTPTITYSSQWRRCDAAGVSCADIPGETGSTYTLTPADVDSTIRVRVTGTNAGGSSGASSSPTATVAAQAPVLVDPPEVTGTTRDTQTLTSTVGAWTGTPTITYARQWRRCDSTGSACVDIAGETGVTYTLTPADVGSTIRMRVVATNAGGSTPASSLPSAPVAPDPPVNTDLPTTSGTTRDGQTLTAGAGVWTGTPVIDFSYQWQRCDATGDSCSDISGATGSDYGLTPADVDQTLRVVVTATNDGGVASATSAATAQIAPDPPVNTDLPVVSGTVRDGQTLTSTVGTWTGTPAITYARQWLRCDAAGTNCADIAGETGATLDLTPADVDGTIRVRVTASNAGGDASADSDPTTTVAPDPPANTDLPTVSGTVRDGQTLTSTVGTWTGTPTITYARQWLRCDAAGDNCDPIAGETGSSYDLTAADVDGTIRVRVTASNAGGDVSADSDPTGAIAPDPPVNTDLPAISGTVRDGQTLTSTVGTWTGTPTITYARQWQRCDADGNACADIAGETGATLELTPADVDGTIRVRVTASNAGGDASATSDPTTTVAPDPPVNTDLPVVSGTERDGQTLTSTVGTWTGTPTITYARQWLRCDAAGVSCTEIAGETGSSYDLRPADVDGTIRIRVTASNAGGDANAASDPTGAIAPDPPVNTVQPSISGTTGDGHTLTADRGTWTGTPTLTYEYQWLRCDTAGDNCDPIAGETGSTLDLKPADVGATIRVRVTATNAGGDADATSDPTGTVAPAAPSNGGAPSITGTATDGQTLTADHGTWTGTPTITFTYQWRRCDAAGVSCADVPGATGPTFGLTPADIGSTLRVVVTASNAGGDVPATSPASDVVTAIPPVNTVVPAITGTTTDGQTVSADQGTWTGSPTITYAYQWQRCDAAGSGCADISGATNATHDVAPADIGHTLRVVVTGSNSGGDTPASSAVTAVVAAIPTANTGTPSITGIDTEGHTLTAGPGTWTGSGPITYTYQWQRCDAAGTHCVDIAGATNATHDLTSTDVGHTLRVIVTATNAAGPTVATSAVTPVIKAAPVTPITPDTPTTTPAGVTPSQQSPATPGADDLGEITGGLLTGKTCRQVVTGLGFRRINAKGVGAIRLRMKADGAVAPDAPLGLALSASARKVRSVKLALDGHALRTKAGRGKWTASVLPTAFADGDVHTLVITVKPRKGRVRTMTETIKTAACATRYTAGQWRTKVGTGLRLRVDSRTALTSVTFPLPAALAKRGALKPAKGLGRLRIVQSGGVRTIFQLGAAGAPKGVLLASAAAGSPSVLVSSRTIVVRDLPAGTGIVEITLYHRGARLLHSKPRLTAGTTGTGAPARLKTKLQRVTGR